MLGVKNFPFARTIQSSAVGNFGHAFRFSWKHASKRERGKIICASTVAVAATVALGYSPIALTHILTLIEKKNIFSGIALFYASIILLPIPIQFVADRSLISTNYRIIERVRVSIINADSATACDRPVSASQNIYALIESDAPNLKTLFSKFFVEIAQNSLLIITMLMVISTAYTRLLGPFSIYILLIIITVIFPLRLNWKNSQSLQDAAALQAETLHKFLNHAKLVAICGETERVARKVVDGERNRRIKSLRWNTHSQISFSLPQIIYVITLTSLLYYLIPKSKLGEISVPFILAVTVYLERLIWPVMAVCNQLSAIQPGIASFNRIISAIQNAEKHELCYIKKQHVIHSIVVNQAKFEGDRLALVFLAVGGNGSGKTSLLRELVGLSISRRAVVYTERGPMDAESLRGNSAYFDAAFPKMLDALVDLRIDDPLRTMFSIATTACRDVQLVAFDETFDAYEGREAEVCTFLSELLRANKTVFFVSHQKSMRDAVAKLPHTVINFPL